MSDIRDKARTILAEVPDEVQSKRDAALFQKFTNGVTHETLMVNWKAGGIRTVCIDFVCWYAAQMGIDIIGPIPKAKRNKDVDGFFALRETLTKGGLAGAWVTASKDGPVPKFGDILRHAAFHVDIAVGLDDKDHLLRIAGGQSSHPRPIVPPHDVTREFDAIKRMRGDAAYNDSTHKLQGWLDIEKFFALSRKPDTPESGKTGHLWFNHDNELVHPDAPAGSGGPGLFRAASTLCGHPYDGALPHPDSPSGRMLDPVRLGDPRDEGRV